MVASGLVRRWCAKHAIRSRWHTIGAPGKQGQPGDHLFTPVGWVSSGGVVRDQQFACTKGFAFSWKVTTPDELTGLALFPHQGWEFNSSGTSDVVTLGCRIAQIHDVESYLRVLMHNIRPDADNIRFSIDPIIQSGCGAWR